jgi:hypothetical protein
LKSVNAYNANYFGFEYQRKIFRTPCHDFYMNTGIGLDWIEIKKNDNIKTSHVIGGLALNVGFSYTFYIKKKHGPHIEVLYHHTDFDNDGGTKINPNSLLIRLSYYFGNYTDK